VSDKEYRPVWAAWLYVHWREVIAREEIDERLRREAETKRAAASCKARGHFWVLNEPATDRWMSELREQNKGVKGWTPPLIRSEWCAKCEAHRRVVAETVTEKKPGPNGRPIEVTRVLGWREAGEEKKGGD